MASGNIIPLHTVKWNTYCLQHRCRSRQVLVSAKDFALISPNLPETSSNFLCEYFLLHKSWRLILGWPPKQKVFMWFCNRWAPFFKIKHFCPYFQSLPRFPGILRRFSWIFLDFARVFRDFRQIKTSGGELAPLHDGILHHWPAKPDSKYTVRNILPLPSKCNLTI